MRNSASPKHGLGSLMLSNFHCAWKQAAWRDSNRAWRACGLHSQDRGRPPPPLPPPSGAAVTCCVRVQVRCIDRNQRQERLPPPPWASRGRGASFVTWISLGRLRAGGGGVWGRHADDPVFGSRCARRYAH